MTETAGDTGADRPATPSRGAGAPGPSVPATPSGESGPSALERVRGRFRGEDATLIDAAVELLGDATEDPARDLREAAEVAAVVVGHRGTPAMAAAALLHRAVDRGDLELDEVRETCGGDVATLLERLGRLGRLAYRVRNDVQGSELRRLVVLLAEDPRVVVVLVAERLCVMRWIDRPGAEAGERERLAREAREVFAPLAHRLGMHPVKVELEDRAFAVLEPEAWSALRADMAVLVPERERTIDEVVARLASALETGGVAARFEARVKGAWSVQRKLRTRGVALEELWDLVGVRIIVADVDACYTALGIVSSLFDQVPGRFKDYVDRPRFGVYQSLHVTCVTDAGTRFEVQIRDEEMHAQATRGVGAHWAYKDAGDPRRLRAEIGWMRDLAEAVATSEETQSWGPDVGDSVAADDTTIVLTPRGEPVALPTGSTPVDFAYAVHTGLGDRTQGARVNDRLVALDTRLQRGDVVEILARARTADAHPSPDWLAFVVSRKARTRIRRHVRRQRNAEAAARGFAALQSALSGPGSRRAMDQLGNWARRNGYADEAAVHVAIGTGRVDAAAVAEELHDPEAAAARAAAAPEPVTITPSRADASIENLRVVDAPWLEVRTTAQCCELRANRPVVGYLGRRGTVTAHAADCVNVTDLRHRAAAGEGAMVELTWS